MAALTAPGKLLLLLLGVALVAPGLRAADASPTDEQVKAVLVFRFSIFTDWPAATFSTDAAPFTIGVVGSDSFAALLEEVVQDERVANHPIRVRRFRAAEAIDPVHILFVDRSAGAQLEQLVAQTKGRSTLTVSDLDDATRHGAMIQLITVNSRIRMRVNVESTRAAGLTLSSNLLRQAEIVRSGQR